MVKIPAVLDLDRRFTRPGQRVGGCDQAHEFTSGIQRVDIAEQRGFAGTVADGRKNIHHGLSEFHIRCGTGLLHDRIHPAADKCDRGKSLLKFPVDISHIASRKVMQAHRKDYDCFGKTLFSSFRAQLADDIRNALESDLFEPARVDVLLFQHDTGEAVDRVHFRGSHDNAAHAVVRTDVDLMSPGQEHTDMNDVPGLMNRRVKLKACSKRNGERSVSYRDPAAAGCAEVFMARHALCPDFLHRVFQSGFIRDPVCKRSELSGYPGFREGADNGHSLLFRFLHCFRAVQ